MSTFKRSVSTLILLALVIAVAPVMLTTSAQQQTCPLKRYYLSGSMVNGREVTKACRDGFHTASLWELFDTSNLRYAAEFGEAALGLDKGSGPPTGFFGWVRTGWSAELAVRIAAYREERIVCFGPAIPRRGMGRRSGSPTIGGRSCLLYRELAHGTQRFKPAIRRIAFGASKIKRAGPTENKRGDLAAPPSLT